MGVIFKAKFKMVIALTFYQLLMNKPLHMKNTENTVDVLKVHLSIQQKQVVYNQ